AAFLERDPRRPDVALHAAAGAHGDHLARHHVADELALDDHALRLDLGAYAAAGAHRHLMRGRLHLALELPLDPDVFARGELAAQRRGGADDGAAAGARRAWLVRHDAD